MIQLLVMWNLCNGPQNIPPFVYVIESRELIISVRFELTVPPYAYPSGRVRILQVSTFSHSVNSLSALCFRYVLIEDVVLTAM